STTWISAAGGTSPTTPARRTCTGASSRSGTRITGVRSGGCAAPPRTWRSPPTTRGRTESSPASQVCPGGLGGHAVQGEAPAARAAGHGGGGQRAHIEVPVRRGRRLEGVDERGPDHGRLGHGDDPAAGPDRPGVPPHADP